MLGTGTPQEAAETPKVATAVSQPRYRSISTTRRINVTVKTFIALLTCVFALYPVVYIISAALNPSNSLVNASVIPSNASLENFGKLANDPQHPFLLWMWNSVQVSGISAIIIVSLTALAAYSFSRFRYRGRRLTLLTIMLVQLFPNSLAIVALFLLLQQIGNLVPWLGLNTLGGLILIYTGGALGFNTWLMKGFFDTIPKELDDSAMIDGASPFQAFRMIILPLARPVLAVIGILSFIGTYSDFLVARVILKSSDNYTLAVGMALFIQGQYAKEWGVFAAAALMGALPIVLVFFILQKQLISGLSTGAVKG